MDNGGIIDLTQEIEDAKRFVTILPCGNPEEPWEVYVDFKQYRLDYKLAKVGNEYWIIGKFGLLRKVLPPKEPVEDYSEHLFEV